MADFSVLLKQFDGSNYSQYFPQNLPLDIANQFVNSQGKNSNDIFNYLRKYCQYWWRKYFEQQITEYFEVKSPFIEQPAAQVKPFYIFTNPHQDTTIPPNFILYSSKSISIDSSGKISLVNPKTTTISFSSSGSRWVSDFIDKVNSFFSQNCPIYYYSNQDSSIYYIENGIVGGYYDSNSYYAEFYSGSSNNEIYEYRSYPKKQNQISEGSVMQFVSSNSKTHLKTETQYVNSINQTAYPDGEKVGDWLYTYLGIPFENSVERVQIAYGTYTGTGSYGANSPNSLIFTGEPKLILIQQNNIFYSDGSGGLLWTGWETGQNIVCKARHNNFTWYSTNSASLQHNSSGEIYYYLILG